VDTLPGWRAWRDFELMLRRHGSTFRRSSRLGFKTVEGFGDTISPESDASLRQVNDRDFFIPNPSINCSHANSALLREVAFR
jgi:hypothetical protein